MLRNALFLTLVALVLGACALTSSLDDRCEFDIHHGIRCDKAEPESLD